MSLPVLLPVVLCGGSGTRLWPLSREAHPKQFLRLLGSHSLLQETVLRSHEALATIGEALPPLMVCNHEHRFLVAEQLQEVGLKEAAILLEPVGRNTAPALTIAALHVAELHEGNDPVLLAMPADHVIKDLAAFQGALRDAYAAAIAGGIVTFGIAPDRVEVGYGYMRCIPVASSSSGSVDVRRVVHFAEKPDEITARNYVASKEYLWNSGFFMVRTSEWLKAVGACRPDILQACTHSMQKATRDLDFIRPEAAAFEACPSDSIDYAVMERIAGGAHLNVPAFAVPLDAGWSDIGAWDALWTALDRDVSGNARVGQVLDHQCEGSLMISSGRLVAGVGLKDVVVVESPDAVLVVDKQRTQEVKQIVNRLALAGSEAVRQHRKVHRPWGWYDTLDQGDRFRVKRIVLHPGAKISLQMHRRRAEHWVVVSGIAEITNGERMYTLGPNESTHIPMGQVHRLANPGPDVLEIIEVQSGSYFGEDDIVRFEDQYGRTNLLEEPSDKAQRIGLEAVCARR